MTSRALSVVDYVIFVGMLLFSTLIGVFFAWRDKRSKKGTEGYLMANRSMSVFPVAVSLAVSFVSAATVLGVPANVYHHGLMYILFVIVLVPMVVFVSYTFIPTFHSLQISTIYEYLERRFNKIVRLITTVAYLTENLFYMGINIYGPAIALKTVTGFSILSSMLTTGLVCTLYTTLGGLKGVIWTDVLQGAFMFLGMTAFIIRGSDVMGGISNVWHIASIEGRTNIRVETDPRIRYTIWSLTVGSFVLWLSLFGTNQAQVQRYLSVKSTKKAIRALSLGAVGVALYSILACVCGLVAYAFYHECDPVTANCITRGDEIMPFAATDLFRDYRGLTGLYLASIVSGSLSSVSSGLNAMVTVTVQHFVKPYTDWTEKQYTWMSKLLVILFGAATLGVSFLASVLGDIVTMTIAIESAFAGPFLGMILLGMWIPFANSIGATCGFLSGLSIGIVMFLGRRGLKLPKEFSGLLEVGIENCPVNCSYMDTINQTGYQTTQPSPISNDFQLLCLYLRILISYFHALGGWQHRHEVDVTLLRPPFEIGIFSKLPEKIRSPLRCGIKWKSQVHNDNSMEIISKEK